MKIEDIVQKEVKDISCYEVKTILGQKKKVDTCIASIFPGAVGVAVQMSRANLEITFDPLIYNQTVKPIVMVKPLINFPSPGIFIQAQQHMQSREKMIITIAKFSAQKAIIAKG